MSEVWFWLAIVYGVVTALWFLFCVIAWFDTRALYPDQAPVAAWWAMRAPLWPLYAVRAVSRGVGALMVDAVKGKPDD